MDESYCGHLLPLVNNNGKRGEGTMGLWEWKVCELICENEETIKKGNDEAHRRRRSSLELSPERERNSNFGE